MPPEIAALRDGGRPLWIFAYGSLIWSPEFAYDVAEPAWLHGYHRRFCLYSYDYRGTRQRPGLVLGLDRGGSCRGMAFRLAPEMVGEAIDRLWAREMTAPRVYDMRRLKARVGGRSEWLFAFTVRREHPDYAGRLPFDEAARIIHGATGSRGACRQYLDHTVSHLEACGIVDRPLRELARRVAAIVERRPAENCGAV